MDFVDFLRLHDLKNSFCLRHEVGFHEDIKKDEIVGGGI